jgi:hypothetical protein
MTYHHKRIVYGDQLLFIIACAGTSGAAARTCRGRPR